MSGPHKHEPHNNQDLFRPRLDSFIDPGHELVVLADRIDWDWLHEQASEAFGSSRGRKALPSRFMLGLLMLKAMSNASDDGICAAWVSNPYFQYFTGEEFFAHRFPHDRSTLSLWRQKLGKDLDFLMQECLRLAFKAGALKAKDCQAVTVDTTVMEKAVSYPTDAKLLYRALKALRDLSLEHKVPIRQSYIRVCKRAI